MNGLAGHFVRAADAVAQHAAEPPPASRPEVDAAGYFCAYLDHDPDRMAPQVAS